MMMQGWRVLEKYIFQEGMVRAEEIKLLGIVDWRAASVLLLVFLSLSTFTPRLIDTFLVFVAYPETILLNFSQQLWRLCPP